MASNQFSSPRDGQQVQSREGLPAALQSWRPRLGLVADAHPPAPPGSSPTQFIFFLFLTSASCLVLIFWEQRVIGNGYHPGVWRRGASKMPPGVEKWWKEPSSLGTSRGLLLLVLSFLPSIGQMQLLNCLHFQCSWVFIGECTVSHASLSRPGPMASLSPGLGRSVSLGAPREVL